MAKGNRGGKRANSGATQEYSEKFAVKINSSGKAVYDYYVSYLGDEYVNGYKLYSEPKKGWKKKAVSSGIDGVDIYTSGGKPMIEDKDGMIVKNPKYKKYMVKNSDFDKNFKYKKEDIPSGGEITDKQSDFYGYKGKAKLNYSNYSNEISKKDFEKGVKSMTKDIFEKPPREMTKKEREEHNKRKKLLSFD